MTEFPSLPLFTDAYLADTRHLSALEHGAYLLLLMMAWRSQDCQLPDDDVKLSKWACVDARTWKRIKPTVMEFWLLDEGQWCQSRLSREREFVSKRAEVARHNGTHGGRPKRLKHNDPDNPAGSARATQQKAPNPNPNAAAQQRAWPVDRLIEAASANGPCHPSLVTGIAQAFAYADKGYDLERDFLPVVRAKASPSIRSWRFFGAIVEDNAKKNREISAPAPDPMAKLAGWPAERWKLVLDQYRATGHWPRETYGPRPGEQGCLVPAELLTAKAA